MVDGILRICQARTIPSAMPIGERSTSPAAERGCDVECFHSTQVETRFVLPTYRCLKVYQGL